MAALHALAFAGQSRGWRAGEFAAMLNDRHVLALGDARCFALGRIVADEAELLTLVTDPAHRRQGLARACLMKFEAAAWARGADTAFLEVAADNVPARRLYDAAGYLDAGRREAYYARPAGDAVDALLLRKLLRTGLAPV